MREVRRQTVPISPCIQTGVQVIHAGRRSVASDPRRLETKAKCKTLGGQKAKRCTQIAHVRQRLMPRLLALPTHRRDCCAGIDATQKGSGSAAVLFSLAFPPLIDIYMFVLLLLYIYIYIYVYTMPSTPAHPTP